MKEWLAAYKLIQLMNYTNYCYLVIAIYWMAVNKKKERERGRERQRGQE